MYPYPKKEPPMPFIKIVAHAKEKEAANIKLIAKIFFLFIDNDLISFLIFKLEQSFLNS